MASMILKIQTPKVYAKKLCIELDKFAFERLAANFGFFSLGFLKSLERAEKDYRFGRVKKIRSLKELRK